MRRHARHALQELYHLEGLLRALHVRQARTHHQILEDSLASRVWRGHILLLARYRILAELVNRAHFHRRILQELLACYVWRELIRRWVLYRMFVYPAYLDIFHRLREVQNVPYANRAIPHYQGLRFATPFPHLSQASCQAGCRPGIPRVILHIVLASSHRASPLSNPRVSRPRIQQLSHPRSPLVCLQVCRLLHPPQGPVLSRQIRHQ